MVKIRLQRQGAKKAPFSKLILPIKVTITTNNAKTKNTIAIATNENKTFSN